MISTPQPFLQGGGDMGARMRVFDWVRTPLGAPDGWSPRLRATLGLLLHSRHAMVLWWGAARVQCYNDGYRQLLDADRDRTALGARGPECRTDVWSTLGPEIEAVMAGGEATWHDDRLVPLMRDGRREEAYWTYGCSPVPDDDGTVGGTLAVVQEQTWHVIGRRRLATLHDLAVRCATRQTDAAVWREAMAVLAENPGDLPFVAPYTWRDETRAELIGQAPGAAAPGFERIFADDHASSRWPLAEVVVTGTPLLVSDLRRRIGAVSGDAWPEPVEAAWVMPIRRPIFSEGTWAPYGLLVAGLSPRLPFDPEYRTFIGLAAEQLAAAIAQARLIEDGRARVAALEEIDRTKTRVFGDISHELRTPLTLMLGPLAESLERTVDDDVRARLALAQRHTRRLQQLVGSLLDFSRLEAGRMQASFAPTDLGPFTADLAGTFRSACEAAGLRLVVDCPPALLAVHVDRDMWEKIVVNLIGNALKFTPEGEIAVTLRVDRAAAVLVVRDTGVGIPPHEQPRVFDRFHRVPGTPARMQEGTGIGLALVRELVEMHGGTIAVRSVTGGALDGVSDGGADSASEGASDSSPHSAPDSGSDGGSDGGLAGRGTIFEVTIPVGTHHLDPDRIRAPRTRPSAAYGSADDATFLLESPLESPEELVGGLAGGLAGRPLHETTHGIRHGMSRELLADDGAELRGEGARLLIVDDHAEVRGYVARLLQERWQVDAVADGATALARAREAPPDLVLCDVMMPGLNGLQLLAALRADERTRAIPVIILSARADEGARIEGLEAGADDYLVKPFSTRELIARIGRQIERARRRAEPARARTRTTSASSRRTR